MFCMDVNLLEVDDVCEAARMPVASSLYHEVARLYACGLTINQIAERVGKSPQTVRNALKTDAAREKIDYIDQCRDGYALRVQKRICDLTEKSLGVYESVLSGVDADGNELKVSLRDKLRVADTVVLELSGFQASKKTELKSSGLVVISEIEEFRRRADEESKRRGHDVIDVEPEEDGGGGEHGVILG